MSQNDKVYLHDQTKIFAAAVMHLLQAFSTLQNRQAMINAGEAYAIKDFQEIKAHFEELATAAKVELLKYLDAEASFDKEIEESIKNHETKSRLNAEKIFLEMCGRSMSVIKYDEILIEAPKQKVKWKADGPLHLCGEFTREQLDAISHWILFAMTTINLGALERNVLKELQAGNNDLRVIAKNLSINTKHSDTLSLFKAAYCNLAAEGLAIRSRGHFAYFLKITEKGKNFKL